MTTQEVADRLVELMRTNQHEKAFEELYHPDIISIENPVHQNGMMKYMEVKGIDAVIKHVQEWVDSVEEQHKNEVEDPIVVDNAFSLVMRSDATFKGGGRMEMNEIGVYSVIDGKIVRSEFIY